MSFKIKFRIVQIHVHLLEVGTVRHDIRKGTMLFHTDDITFSNLKVLNAGLGAFLLPHDVANVAGQLVGNRANAANNSESADRYQRLLWGFCNDAFDSYMLSVLNLAP